VSTPDNIEEIKHFLHKSQL